MNKLCLLTLSALMLSTTAMADMNLKPYVGFDYSMVQTDSDFKDVAKSNVNAVGVTVGTQFNQKFGAEAFYLKNVSNGAKENGDYNVTSYGLVGTYEHPLYEQLYAKFAAGLAYTKNDFEYKTQTYRYYKESTGAGFAGKIGLGYNICPNFATELTYNVYNSNNGFNLQAKYKF